MEDIQEPRRRNIKLKRKENKYFFLILFLIFSTILFKKLGFIINVSDSLPLGIYKIIDNNKEYIVGDYVVINPPSKFKNFIYERGYLIKDGIVKTMLKQIVGIEKDRFSAIRTSGTYKFLVIYKNNNENLGIIQDVDSKGRELPHIEDIVLGKDEYFVMGSAYKSFDSRYFGSIKKDEIIYKVKPILVF